MVTVLLLIELWPKIFVIGFFCCVVCDQEKQDTFDCEQQIILHPTLFCSILMDSIKSFPSVEIVWSLPPN